MATVLERSRNEAGQRPLLQPTALLTEVLGNEPMAVIREGKDPFLVVLSSSRIDSSVYPEELGALQRIYAFDGQTADEVRNSVLNYEFPTDVIVARYMNRQLLRSQMLDQFTLEAQSFIRNLDEITEQAFYQSSGIFVGVGFERFLGDRDETNGRGVFTSPQTGGYEIRVNNGHYEHIRVGVDSNVTTRGQVEVHTKRHGEETGQVGEYPLTKLMQSPLVLIGAVGTGGEAYRSAFNKLAKRTQQVAQETRMPMIDIMRILTRLTTDGYKKDNDIAAGAFIVIKMTDEALEDLPTSQNTPLSGDFDAGLMVLDAAFASGMLPKSIQKTKGFDTLVSALHGGLLPDPDDLRQLAIQVLHPSPRLAETLRKLNLVAQGTRKPTAEALMYILSPLLCLSTDNEPFYLPHGTLVQAQPAQDGKLTTREMQIVAQLGSAIEQAQSRGDERAAANFIAALKTYLDQKIQINPERQQTTNNRYF